jgi:hypothetical protein
VWPLVTDRFADATWRIKLSEQAVHCVRLRIEALLTESTRDERKLERRFRHFSSPSVDA